nr:MAG TPA: hypothetical protein [Caudoviricetes sp.]
MGILQLSRLFQFHNLDTLLKPFLFLPSLQIIPLNPFKRKKIHEKVIKVFSKFLILIAIVFLKFSRYPFILGKILQTF